MSPAQMFTKTNYGWSVSHHFAAAHGPKFFLRSAGLQQNPTFAACPGSLSTQNENTTGTRNNYGTGNATLRCLGDGTLVSTARRLSGEAGGMVDGSTGQQERQRRTDPRVLFGLRGAVAGLLCGSGTVHQRSADRAHTWGTEIGSQHKRFRVHCAGVERERQAG